MTHTPGPWEYGFSHWGRWQIDSAKDHAGASFHIAELPSYGELGGKEVALNEQQKANARLIAAAPDLLEALRIAVNRADENLKEYYGGFRDPDCQKDYERCKAAIVKATGEP